MRQRLRGLTVKSITTPFTRLSVIIIDHSFLAKHECSKADDRVRMIIADLDNSRHRGRFVAIISHRVSLKIGLLTPGFVVQSVSQYP